MKKYKCIFNNKDKYKRTLVSGLKAESLTQPITISIKEEEYDDDVPRPSKERSEVVEDEPEIEEKIYEVADADNRVYTSKRVLLPSNYFAFINIGSSLRVVPISEWQRFSLKNAYSGVLEDVVIADLDVKEKGGRG